MLTNVIETLRLFVHTVIGNKTAGSMAGMEIFKKGDAGELVVL